MQSKGTILEDCKLGNLITLKHGYAFKSQFFSNKGNKIVTTPGNFIDQGGFKHKGDNKEKWYDGPIPDGFELSKGDLIVAMTEQMYGLLGSSAIIPESNKYLHNQRLGLVNSIDENRLDKKFLYYLFNAKYVRDQIQATANGAKVRHTSIPKIYDVKVKLPLLEYQQFVGEALYNYDNLIENNNRRIAILEEMAQSIYREWFVKFGFPGYENIKFIDSQLGKIPEGWEIVKVVDLLQKVKRKKKIKKSEYLDAGEIPVIDQGRDFIGGYTNDEVAENSDQLPVIIFGDHTRILKFIDFPYACGADGTQLLISNNDRMPMSLFYWTLLAIDLSNFAYARHFKFLKDQDVLLPNTITAKQYDEYISPIHDQIQKLANKNSILMKQRDLLLPRLISGNIQI